MARPPGLRRRSEFLRAFKQGKSCRGENLELFVRERGDELPARFGFAAARSVGGAVVRNRMRRRLREVAASSGAKPGIDVVVRVKTTMEYAQLNEEVRRCLKKFGAVS